MTAGMQLFNTDGSLWLDLTGRYGKFLGQVYTGEASGAINVPEFTQGQPFAILVNLPANWGIGGYPLISISGTTLSWTFGRNMDTWGVGWTNYPATIAYGIL